ncbi:hypothetical protein CBL_07331 [Carabus blaptoides fortunei]
MVELFPSESEVVLPLEHEELPILEEPVVHESAPKSDDLSVLYDYLYPMVLRKCLASAISSSMGLNSEDYNVNYNHQMKYIDHPLVQISGLDTLEELRRNLTEVAAARRRFSSLPKMTSGCVFHFNEIDADMQAAREDLLMSHAELLSEEDFRMDNKYIVKYEKLFKKNFMMHIIIRKLYELLKNHTSIYNVILALDADLENSELTAYPDNEYKARGRSFRRAFVRRDHPMYETALPRYYRRSEMNHISEADEVKHAADLNVPVPEVEIFEQEINNPVGKPVEFVHEPEVFVNEVPSEHQQEVIPHEFEMLPSKSEVPIESLASPLEHEELQLLEEPVVPKSEDLSVLYDYLYPMVLRKCLASAISSSMGLKSGDYNANYNHQMKHIDHPVFQIAGIDTLEELRRNLTAVAAARR